MGIDYRRVIIKENLDDRKDIRLKRQLKTDRKIQRDEQTRSQAITPQLLEMMVCQNV